MAPRPAAIALGFVALFLVVNIPTSWAADAGAPTSVVVVAGENRLVVTWAAPTTGTPDGYRVYRVQDGPDALLASLPSTALRHVDAGLADGETRAYRVVAVVGGAESTSDEVSGTTFAAPATRTSSFASSADGFTQQRAGGSTVSWRSDLGALALAFATGEGAADEVMARALPATWTDREMSFTLTARFGTPYASYGTLAWPLALTTAGSTDVAARASTIGIRYNDTPGDEWDDGQSFDLYYRDASGAEHSTAVSWYGECQPWCTDEPAAWNLSIAYDAHTRVIDWVVESAGKHGAWSYHVGAANDGFAVTHVAVATDVAGQRAITYAVDDVVLTSKRSDAGPTRPHTLGAERTAPSHVSLAWSAPRDAGTEPVTSYTVLRDGVAIGTSAATSFVDTTSARWASHSYSVRASSEIGAGIASLPRGVTPEAGRHHQTVGFEAAPPTWHNLAATYPSQSRVRLFESTGEARVVFDHLGTGRYGAFLDGRPWTHTMGSFQVESTWTDLGWGARTGACPLAIIPATAQGCQGAGTVSTEFRAENRSASSPPTARLRFVDDSGVTRISLTRALVTGEVYTSNATYDLPTRTLTLRLKDVNGTVLSSGSHTIPPGAAGFSLGFVGIVAGLAPYSFSPDDGVISVDSFAFAFDAPQPAGLPTAPADVVGAATGVGRAQVSWSAVAGASGYTLYRRVGDDRVLVARTTSLSHEQTGLMAGSTATYEVSATNAAGEGLLGEMASVRAWGRPGALRMSAATGPGVGEISVRWGSVAADPGGAPTQGIQIYRDGAPIALAAADATGWIDTGRAEGAWHYYSAHAVNAVGAGDGDSEWGRAPSRPSALGKPVAVPGPGAGEVSLSWQEPWSDGGLAHDFVVYRSLEGGPRVAVAEPGAALSWRDSGLAAGALVNYTVVARNAVGESAHSPPVALRAPDLPSAPRNLTLTRGPGVGEVTLAWDAPASTGGVPLAGYVVLRDGAVVGSPSAAAFRDAGLAPGVAHVWSVAARNVVGDGAGASVAGTAPAAPTAPRTLAGAPGPNLGAVRLTWSAPADDGGLGVDRYRVYRTLDGARTLVADVLGAPSHVDTGLPDGALVRHEVVAVNAVGEGAAATVETRTWTRAVPGAVGSLAAQNAGLGLVRVSWQAPAENGGQPAQRYLVYRIGGVQGETLATTVIGGTSWIDTPTSWARQPATEYRYRVVAVNEAGAGAEALSGAASPLP